MIVPTAKSLDRGLMEVCKALFLEGIVVCRGLDALYQNRGLESLAKFTLIWFGWGRGYE